LPLRAAGDICCRVRDSISVLWPVRSSYSGQGPLCSLADVPQEQAQVTVILHLVEGEDGTIYVFWNSNPKTIKHTIDPPPVFMAARI